jgi:cobalt/nickel transport protein
MLRIFLSAFILALACTRVGAHYNILLPNSPSTKKGEKVTFTHLWGHPFEHEISDAPAPRQVFAITPDGQRLDLTKGAQTIKVPGADGKEVNANRFDFVPEMRGDYTFVLVTAPAWMEDQKESVEDVVKVVLHVQTQKGWGAYLNEPTELVPITRPYGLLPGMVFQARALFPLPPEFAKGKERSQPLAGALVEFERYNDKPTKEGPEDELMTFRTQTDSQGVLTGALPEPGWWGITVSREAGTFKAKGELFPLKQRLTLWVHVSEKK